MTKNITIITGASSGIGLELAWILASNNHNLLIIARHEDKLNELAKAIQIKHQVTVDYLVKDLSKPESTQEIFKYCQEKQLFVDILINNAGFGDFCEFSDSNRQRQLDMINVNISSLVSLTHLFLKDMINNNEGKIMNIASAAAFQPGPLMSVYYATKAFVLHFSEAIANELKDKNITLTTICPGPTASNFKQSANLNNSRLMKKRNLPSSRSVAEFSYQAMIKGRVIAIPGFSNWLLSKLVNIIPRPLVVKMVRKIQEKF
ncbi:MAG: SDR family oxidoreductase [Patescibacteria group bacterium]|nr:SDR family oxidoreductase [Patescibacteria group bacterium]